MTKRNADDLLVSPTCVQVMPKKMDIKSTPSKEEVLCESDNEIMKEIEQLAPPWFVKAFTHLTGELTDIKKKLSDSIGEVKKDVTVEVKKLEDRIIVLEREKEVQGRTIKKLQASLTDLESYTRRDNLLIDGILESPNEDPRKKVLSVFADILEIPGANSMQLSRVHRLGTPNHLMPHSSKRPRTIIIRFQFFPDREAVWKARFNLKGKGIYISEDFPNSVKQNRKVLVPCFKEAKKDVGIKKCYLKGDRLTLDDRTYTVEDVDKLPLHLRWTIKGEKYIPHCDTTFFFGIDSFLSNFHPAYFKEDSAVYSCSEQYYLYKKSLFFDDEHTATAIKRTTDPREMKSLTNRIKGLDEAKWKPHAKLTMEKACHLKFDQNPYLKKKLLNSRGALVEANRNDNFFSCGLALSDPNILDKTKWLGDNHLGQILMQVRQSLA